MWQILSDSTKAGLAPPPKRNSNRKYQIPYHNAAGFSRSSSNPFEDSYASSVGEDSYLPSNTISSGSSFTQANLDIPDAGFLSVGHESDFFRDQRPAEKRIQTPATSSQGSLPALRPVDASKQSSESSAGGDSIHVVSQPTKPPNAAARLPGHASSPLAETITSPELAIKEASEAQRVTVKDQQRGKRNIVAQKYLVTGGLVAAK